MPPQIGYFRINKPIERPYDFSRQKNDNDFSNEDALRISKAQLKRYENDPEWNTSNNRNEAIKYLRNTKIPELIKQIESRKRTCQKVTNAITGTVRSVCGIQRHRTRKNRRSRKMTRRVR
jgi:hypothetical protein